LASASPKIGNDPTMAIGVIGRRAGTRIDNRDHDPSGSGMRQRSSTIRCQAPP
jgi:hypothetical protein